MCVNYPKTYTKKEIVDNWLPRYTGKNLEDIGSYILLTNFTSYVDKFAHRFDVPVEGIDKNMPNATANGITITLPTVLP